MQLVIRRGLGFPLLLLLVCAAIALSAFSLRGATTLVWFWLTWAVALIASSFFVKGEWTRATLLNLGVAAAFLTAAEGYFSHHEPQSAVVSPGYFLEDDILGTVPAKNFQAHATKRVGDHVYYDVTYSVGRDGLRVAPPWKPADLAGTVLFFGDSFAYGEGLQDTETLPYQVGVQSGGRYRTFNFAFHGYGPNHMLAALEHGVVQRIADTNPQYAIYVAIPAQVWRVAGKVSYGQHSPRYLLKADGSVVRAGDFEGLHPLDKGATSFVKQCRKSAIYRRFVGPYPRVSDHDIALYFAIVLRSKNLLETEYPGLQFHVILWPELPQPGQPVYDELLAGFTRLGIKVHLASEILPDYRTNPTKYYLNPADRHPNARANRILAEYVLTKILAH
ncbi:MAG: hypothetical protein WB952_12160 [Terriglobales bacterium]